MGIPGFRSWLEETYRSTVVKDVEGNEVDNLYLDVNEIIYSCAKLDDSSVLRSEAEIINLVCQSIDEIFSIVRPHKLLYIAIDGVAPKAKMHNQREGLFLRAKNHSSEDKQFTKFDIKPGTKFMSRLSEELQSYINYRMNTSPIWSSIIVILSDANVPGEGEHKIMDFIRTQKYHKSNTKHVLFSTDSDMVLLGLTLHSDYVWIMRGKNDKTESYTFINLGKLREEIKKDLTNNIAPSEGLDAERIIDDWILMWLLAGNDFLPNLPYIEFYHMKELIEYYKTYVLQKNGYLTEDAKGNFKNLKILLKHIGEKERETVVSLLEQSQAPSNFSLEEVKKQEPVTNSSTLRFSPPSFKIPRNPLTGNQNEANASAPSTVPKNNYSTDADQSYKNDWYRKKLNFKKDELEKKSMEVAENYAQGLCWMLRYYYEGVPSWDWYYPYYYAPLASTFSNLQENISDNFSRNSRPLKPFEHMLATFPKEYTRYFPVEWQKWIQDKETLKIDYYQAGGVSDQNGKRFESQYVIKLPFVNEQDLFDDLKSAYTILSEDEKRRNRQDVDRLFIHQTNPYYQHFNVNENGKTLSENMNGQIMPEDENFRQNNQVLCVKYRNRPIN